MADFSPPKKEQKFRWLKLLLKIGVSGVCLWYVSTKIDFGQAGMALRNANWYYLFIALMFFVLSKLVAAFRLNIYFRDIGLGLSENQNIRLYWLGMFYNLFLPGSIGGDAYKIVLLTRRFSIPYRKTAAAVLLDRFSGVLGLVLILAVYAVIVIPNRFYMLLIIAGALLACAGLYILVRIWFRDFVKSFFPTLFLGLVVQVSQVICVYFIMYSLKVPLSESAWIFIFLAAAVITILPISLGGGLGTREFVFREGALLFLLDPDIAVIISLLFYLCTLVGSLPGAYFVFHEPINKKRTQE